MHCSYICNEKSVTDIVNLSFAELSSTLVNWNPSLIKIPDESGSTPLHYLAAGDDFISYIDGYSYTIEYL